MGFKQWLWSFAPGRAVATAATSVALVAQPALSNSSPADSSPKSSEGGSTSPPSSGLVAPLVYGTESAQQTPLKLLQVHVFFRHGDRSPIPIKQVAFSDAVFWESRIAKSPDGIELRDYTHGKEYPFGQLTRRGVAQARTLGRMLRDRYGGFLNLHGLATATAAGGGGERGNEVPRQDGGGGPLPEGAGEEDEDYVPPNVPGASLSETLVKTSSLPADAATASPWQSIIGLYKRPLSGRAARKAKENGGDNNSNEKNSASEGPDGATLAALIRARATDFSRTHMTGFHVLAGLLASEQLASRLPMTIRDEKDENLYNNDHCSRLAVLFRQSMRSIAERTWHLDMGWRAKVEWQAKILAEAVGVPLEKLPWVAAVDVIECRHLHGQDLPHGLVWRDICELRRHLSQDYALVFGHREVARLAMGRLINETMTSMENVLKKSAGEPRLALYSGHDATIMPLSACLGVPFPTWPQYTSSIIIELWTTEDESNQFVRVLYNGEPVVLPTEPPAKGYTWQDEGPWIIPGTVLCPWERFVKLTNWTRMTDEEFCVRCQIRPEAAADASAVETKHV